MTAFAALIAVIPLSFSAVLNTNEAPTVDRVVDEAVKRPSEAYPEFELPETEAEEPSLEETLPEEETENIYFDNDEDDFAAPNTGEASGKPEMTIPEETETEETTEETAEETTEETTTEETTTVPETTVPETTVPETTAPTKPNGKDFIGCDGEYVKVYDHDTGKYSYMLLGEYLVGVVAAEMPSYFGIEALKAQAIACRTFTLYRMEDMSGNYHSSYHGKSGSEVCTYSGHCQAYMSYSEAYARWGRDYADAIFDVSRQAVLETSGMVATYKGELIDAVYHSCSYKSTDSIENVWSADYPYLTGVPTPETPENLSSLVSEAVFSSAEVKKLVTRFNKKASFSADPSTWISSVTLNSCGKTEYCTIGGVKLTGQNMRAVFSLRSSMFTWEYDKAADEFTFTVYGFGHSVGLSQYGAMIYADQGYSAEWIIKHYYTGVEIVIAK